MGQEKNRRIRKDDVAVTHMGQGGGVLEQNNGDREVKTWQKCETYLHVFLYWR